jgi:cbb3-type cytochrome oxidase subunit 3
MPMGPITRILVALFVLAVIWSMKLDYIGLVLAYLLGVVFIPFKKEKKTAVDGDGE